MSNRVHPRPPARVASVEGVVGESDAERSPPITASLTLRSRAEVNLLFRSVGQSQETHHLFSSLLRWHSLLMRWLSLLFLSWFDPHFDHWHEQVQRLDHWRNHLKQLQRLEVDCRCLKTLPGSLDQLQALRILRLDGCYAISELPDSTCNLERLREFVVSSAKITALPERLGDLTALCTLEASDCRALNYLPGSVTNLTWLQTLDVHGCKLLSALPSDLGHLKALQTLNLAGCCAISELPNSLFDLKHLQELVVSSTTITALPERLGDLTALCTLEASDCRALKYLPSSVTRLARLQTLDMHGCDLLSALPSDLGHLKALQTLNLCGCCAIFELPDSLFDLENLEKLILSDMSITALPERLGDLAALCTLEASNCRALKYLPSSVTRLARLRTLDVHGCWQLQALPSDLGHLTALQTLNVTYCMALASLPDSIEGCSAVQALLLCGCMSLLSLPRAVWGLKELRELDLENCQEAAFNSLMKHFFSSWCQAWLQAPRPSGASVREANFDDLHYPVGGWWRLDKLTLRGCKGLKHLPGHIEEFKALTMLDLRGCNSLATLPESLSNLTSLQILRVGCSKLQLLPESIKELHSLKMLDLQLCERLETLPEGINCLSALVHLHLDGCISMCKLPGFHRDCALQVVTLADCTSLTSLVPLTHLHMLCLLNITGCNGLMMDEWSNLRVGSIAFDLHQSLFRSILLESMYYCAFVAEGYPSTQLYKRERERHWRWRDVYNGLDIYMSYPLVQPWPGFVKAVQAADMFVRRKAAVHSIMEDKAALVSGIMERYAWVGILLSTVTYAAVAQPAGGYDENGNLQLDRVYRVYYTFNTCSFSFSICTVLIAVGFSMPRIGSSDALTDATSVWWLLVAASGMLVAALLTGCAAFWAGFWATSPNHTLFNELQAVMYVFVVLVAVCICYLVWRLYSIYPGGVKFASNGTTPAMAYTLRNELMLVLKGLAEEAAHTRGAGDGAEDTTGGGGVGSDGHVPFGRSGGGSSRAQQTTRGGEAKDGGDDGDDPGGQSSSQRSKRYSQVPSELRAAATAGSATGLTAPFVEQPGVATSGRLPVPESPQLQRQPS